ncbi:uncharacterized protein LOC114524101 [Dendronephthya gigantea]|uniref:uncharacterized protein LOC114524101 n=1 Tax=Dendronephthya gigantea TaxID=151771 RepID=UPI00106CC9BF|nr:uncharacterized protein LOC114524101 [Dendronephthya gigantea]
MFNGVYFSRPLTFMIKGGKDVLFSRGNRSFSGILMRFVQSTLDTNRSVSKNANVLCQNVDLLAHSKSIPVVLRLRYYQRGSASSPSNLKSWRKRLWTVVRGVFVATGGFVWLVIFAAYFALDKVTVDVLENDKSAAANTLQKKLAEHFYKEKHEAEILKKESALDSVWEKLSKEEEIKEIFGQPLYVCGYNYRFMSDAQDLRRVDGKVEEKDERESFKETLNESTWEAGCYIEGPKKMGVMDVKFEKHKEEWIPVSLRVETLEKTGHVVSNVSASLPNGITNFTRLSN